MIESQGMRRASLALALLVLAAGAFAAEDAGNPYTLEYTPLEEDIAAVRERARFEFWTDEKLEGAIEQRTEAHAAGRWDLHMHSEDEALREYEDVRVVATRDGEVVDRPEWALFFVEDDSYLLRALTFTVEAPAPFDLYIVSDRVDGRYRYRFDGESLEFVGYETR